MPFSLRRFVRRRLDPEGRYGLRLTLFCLALSLVALPFAFLLSQVVSGGPIVKHDEAISDQIVELRNRYPSRDRRRGSDTS